MKRTLLAVSLFLLPVSALAAAPGPVQAPAAKPVQGGQGQAPGDQPAAGLPRPALGPPPAWVNPVALPKPPSDSDGAATVDLLGDVQARFDRDLNTIFHAAAWQIGTAQGLDGSDLNLEWDPALDRLTIHHYRILRGGRPIDLLGDGLRIKVIQRESGLENAMLDGRLSATLQPEDLRVGDIVELAYSIETRDPAIAGHSEYLVGPSDGSAFGRFHVRLLWGSDKRVQWKAYPGILQPRLIKTPQGSELVADITNGTAPLGPEGAPARFGLVNAIELSDYGNWQGVSRTAAPLYARASALAPDSPLHAEAAGIAAQTEDPKRRAELALKLVQEQVRYLFLGMNDGGYVPAPADQTWVRRFGDCKGKTVLLLALLRELGVDARPVLVNTKGGDLVGSRMPGMGVFDHVIVEARIDGRSYWLDGTRLGDERLDLLETPGYRFGLPVEPAGAGLVAMVPADLTKPRQLISLTLDASQGLDVPAKVIGEMRFHGTSASDMRISYAGYSQAERQRELRKLWRETYDFVAPGKIVTRSDPETGEFIISMTGSAQMDWNRDLGTRWYEMDRSRLGWRFDIAREGELNADAPYAFDYPDWWGFKETIILPHEGRGFTVQGEAVDRTIGDLFRFHRAVTKVGAAVTVETETRALAAELPAARASRTRAQMIELSTSSVFIRMPDDYEPTAAEKDLARREDEAERTAQLRTNPKASKRARGSNAGEGNR